MRIETRNAYAPWRPDRRIVLYAVIGFILASAVGGAGAFLFRSEIRDTLRVQARRLGWTQDHSRTGNPATDALYAPGAWAGSLLRRADLPRMAIDIKFRNLETLRQRRAEALAMGVYEQEEGDLVPAVIRLEDRAVRVRVRLKGDAVEGQFGQSSWSFRVQVRGDDHVQGMRRFNLQPAFARDFHSEPLFLHHVRSAGVLAPRFSFVRVSLNGDDLGIMAIEEHFSKELLESQGRREGVILKLDESKYWAFTARADRFASPLGNFYTARMVPFRMTTVAGNPALLNDLQVATGLYKGFIAGEIPASEVFDAELMGRFLALVDTWSAWHAASWRNIRFYYNPVTARLEPIAYDAELRLIGFHTPEPMHGLLFADSQIRNAYESTLRRLASDSEGGVPVQELQEMQDRMLPVLHRRFPLLTPLDIEGLPAEAAARLEVDPVSRVRFAANSDPRYERPPPTLGPDRFRASDLILADRIEVAGGGSLLELRNLVPFPVSVRLPAADSLGADGGAVELEVPPTELGSRPTPVTVEDAAPDSLFVSTPGGQPGAWVYPARSYPERSSRPVPAPSLADASDHPAFDYDAGLNVVKSLEGTWTVEGVISLPEGVGLELAAGTELLMGPGAAIIVRGPTRFRGEPAAPVVLRANDPLAPWKGLAVFNVGTAAEWSDVQISGTSGLAFPDWSLTGSVALHGGEVTMTRVSFADTRAEDALNLINTRFTVTDIAVTEADSDGVDVDFGEGVVHGGVFTDIGFGGGGDALDFAGARARVVGTRFSRVGDKAISVGEGSQVWVDSVLVRDAGVAIVSKDGSFLSASGASVRDSRHFDFMAYVKKPEYGGTFFTIGRPDVGSAAPRVKVQTGSAIELDGSMQEVEDFDVDVLYNTIMRKGSG